MRDTINETLKDVPMENVYSVDYVIPVGRLSKEDVLKVGRMSKVWGNTIPEPKFAITDLTIDTKDIGLIGERRNTLKFKKRDITFIKFYCNEEFLNEMTMKKKNGFGKNPKTVVLDLVCTFETNEYEGVDYPQVNIVDYNVREKEEVLF